MTLKTCNAYASDYPGAHSCDDPVACAVDSLIAGPNPRDEELDRLRNALDEVRELIDGNRTKLALSVRQAIDS